MFTSENSGSNISKTGVWEWDESSTEFCGWLLLSSSLLHDAMQQKINNNVMCFKVFIGSYVN